MDSKGVINALLRAQGRSRRSLAKQVGMVPQTLDNMLTRTKDMSVGNFSLLLDALGYELNAVPKDIERPSFPIDGNEREGRE